MDVSLRKTVDNSFVISRDDYCNSLLAGVPRYQLDWLHAVCAEQSMQQHDLSAPINCPLAIRLAPYFSF